MLPGNMLRILGQSEKKAAAAAAPTHTFREKVKNFYQENLELKMDNAYEDSRLC